VDPVANTWPPAVLRDDRTKRKQLRMFGHDEHVPRAANCELETICSMLLR
jgi:hypothetical protein